MSCLLLNRKSRGYEYRGPFFFGKVTTGAYVLALLLLVACGGGGGGPDAALPAPSTNKIVLVGTSLTERGFAPLFENHPEIRMEIVNAGHGGWYSSDLLTVYEKEVISEKPKIILIETAINDCYYRLPFDDMEDNLKAMIERGRSVGARVILMTTNPATEAREDLAAYYEMVRIIAIKNGVELIDLYPLWNPDLFCEFVPDGVHPTVEGLEEVGRPLIQDVTFSF